MPADRDAHMLRKHIKRRQTYGGQGTHNAERGPEVTCRISRARAPLKGKRSDGDANADCHLLDHGRKRRTGVRQVGWQVGEAQRRERGEFHGTARPSKEEDK